MFRRIAASLLLLSGAALAQQDFELEDCRISTDPGAPGIPARCGKLVRPLDPSNPDAGNIELRVAVVAALSLEPAPDPFVPIAGGPGQSTITFYAGWSQAFDRVRRDRDILLVDQRGTGESAAMSCEIDEDLVEGKYSDEQTLRLTRECMDGLPHDPRFFTTSIAVQDLEAVRKALGYGPLNLYGISYGTRVAQHFARRFPESTRTVILDGVVPPQLPLGPDIATESQNAIESVFDRCAERPACHERFPSVREDFLALRQTLADGAVTVEFQHPVTARLEPLEFSEDQFAGAVRLLLYSPRTVALLPLVITEAANGNYKPLAAQYTMVASSLADALNIGMHNAVMCTEDAPFIDWASLDYEAINASYMGPLQLQAIRTMCSVWPAGTIDDDLREPLATDKPVLLLSGGADPITPAYFADLAAVELDQHWQLVGKDQGHGLAPVGCMPKIIAGFVNDGTLEDGAADCLENAFVMPFFVDYSGPTP